MLFFRCLRQSPDKTSLFPQERGSARIYSNRSSSSSPSSSESIRKSSSSSFFLPKAEEALLFLHRLDFVALFALHAEVIFANLRFELLHILAAQADGFLRRFGRGPRRPSALPQLFSVLPSAAFSMSSLPKMRVLESSTLPCGVNSGRSSTGATRSVLSVGTSCWRAAAAVFARSSVLCGASLSRGGRRHVRPAQTSGVGTICAVRPASHPVSARLPFPGSCRPSRSRSARGGGACRRNRARPGKARWYRLPAPCASCVWRR